MLRSECLKIGLEPVGADLANIKTMCKWLVPTLARLNGQLEGMPGASVFYKLNNGMSSYHGTYRQQRGSIGHQTAVRAGMARKSSLLMAGLCTSFWWLEVHNSFFSLNPFSLHRRWMGVLFSIFESILRWGKIYAYTILMGVYIYLYLSCIYEGKYVKNVELALRTREERGTAKARAKRVV